MSNRIPTTDVDFRSGYASGGIIDAIEKWSQVEVDTVAGAIAIREGVVIINGSGALAMTLFTPIAGLPSAGGDDGRVLRIIAGTAHAHTVTTAQNKIDSTDDTVTFAAKGDVAELVAYNGIWYALLGGPTPASLSEV